MTTATHALAERIAQTVPTLRPLLAELWGEQLGDALPLVFLEEGTRRLTDQAAAGDAAAVSALTALAGLLEAELGSTAEVDELISAGFLVPLPYPGEPGTDLVRLLGPKLAGQLQRQREWRTPPAEAEFVARLVARVPALQPLVEVNRAGNYGDVLPHMFLGDVVAREVENIQSGSPAAQLEVRAVLDGLEAELGVDPGVDNAIAASFVEILPYPGEAGAGLVDLLGPKLAAELRRQRSGGPGPPR